MSPVGLADLPVKMIPPYVPYRTFVTFLESLKGGVPSRIDKSVLRSMSGGVRGWLKASLRSMRLIDTHDAPTSALHKIAAADGAIRQRLLKELFNTTYGFLDRSVDLAVATPAQVEAAFVARGAKGDTVRKSIGFMLAMAKESGIELSPHLLRRGAISRTDSRMTKRSHASARTTSLAPLESRATARTNSLGPDSTGHVAELVRKLPDFDADWNDELKVRWFDAFGRLMNAILDQ